MPAGRRPARASGGRSASSADIGLGRSPAPSNSAAVIGRITSRTARPVSGYIGPYVAGSTLPARMNRPGDESASTMPLIAQSSPAPASCHSSGRTGGSSSRRRRSGSYCSCSMSREASRQFGQREPPTWSYQPRSGQSAAPPVPTPSPRPNGHPGCAAGTPWNSSCKNGYLLLFFAGSE